MNKFLAAAAIVLARLRRLSSVANRAEHQRPADSSRMPAERAGEHSLLSERLEQGADAMSINKYVLYGGNEYDSWRENGEYETKKQAVEAATRICEDWHYPVEVYRRVATVIPWAPNGEA